MSPGSTDAAPVGIEEPAGTSSGPAGPEGATPAPRRHRRWFVEWGIIVILAVVVAVVVRAFVFQTFYVPSASMYPTLKPGDRIVVSKLSYHLHAIHRGDIIVFSRPPAEDCGGPPVPDLVKRVIGLPGETVSFRNNSLYIDGKLTPEPWLPAPTANSNPHTTNYGPFTVPQGDYFMMGDNRTSSCDSRSWGPIKGSSIVGKVVVLIWPVSRIHFF